MSFEMNIIKGRDKHFCIGFNKSLIIYAYKKRERYYGKFIAKLSLLFLLDYF